MLRKKYMLDLENSIVETDSPLALFQATAIHHNQSELHLWIGGHTLAFQYAPDLATFFHFPLNFPSEGQYECNKNSSRT